MSTAQTIRTVIRLREIVSTSQVTSLPALAGGNTRYMSQSLSWSALVNLRLAQGPTAQSRTTFRALPSASGAARGNILLPAYEGVAP